MCIIKKVVTKKSFQIFMIFMIIGLSQACSNHSLLNTRYVHDYSDDYLKSENGAELKIPNDLKPQPISHYYDVAGEKAKEKSPSKSR